MKTTILTIILLMLVVTAVTAGGTNAVPKKNFVLLPVKNDPAIDFRLWFRVGSQNDPAGKEGLSALTAEMLTDASTKNNSYDQIIDKLFPLAASYRAQASTEMTVIFGGTHKDNLKEFYPLFIDAILAPAFKQEDLDRIKSRMLNAIENDLRYSSDEELGKAVLYNSIFAGTPYGHITNGLVQSLKSITLDDLRAFYAKYYTRDNVVVGLGGSYPASLVATIASDLGKLPAGAPPEIPKPVPQQITGKKVVIVDKDAHSTAISLGFPIDVLRGSKEWYALAIANSWLGEHRNSSSHLYQVIREARGLNYGDYSYIENYPQGGFRSLPPQNVCRRQQIFEIWIRPVPNETGHFALRAALRELDKLVTNGMTQSQFNLTKNFLKKYVLHYAETTMERLAYKMDDRFYGIKGSHLDIYRSMMDKLTLADVNAAVKKYLGSKNTQIAIVTTEGERFMHELAADGDSPITYKTPKPESVMNEDKEIISYKLGIGASDIQVVPVAELFEK
jgi:zinc protease